MFAGGSTYSGLAAAGGTGSNSNASGNAGSRDASGNSGSSSGGVASSGAFANAVAEANDLDALVFEFGTAKCKFGFAGEDAPRVYESPLDLEKVPYDRRRAACMESDYEAIAQWLFDAAGSRMQTRLSDHPLLLVERPFAIPDEYLQAASSSTGDSEKKNAEEKETTAAPSSGSKKRDFKSRERMVEVLMETMDLPALFCAKSAVLACYANARTSGLVVEMGATYSSVTSVHDGYAFAYPKSQMRLYGGHDLDAFLSAKLAPQLAGVKPASPFPSRFYWSLATEAKESGLCRVADGPFDELQNAQLPKIGYELPDKTIVQLGTERFSVGEQFFPQNGSTAGTGTGTEIPFENTEVAVQYGVKPALALPEFICETGAMTTEAELRKELFQNIVLTGGSSCFENLPTRLEREVVVALSSHPGLAGTGTIGFGSTRVKLVAAHAQERRLGSFLGGSILASLGSFHEMWLSKAEYAEHGAALIHKKCP